MTETLKESALAKAEASVYDVSAEAMISTSGLAKTVKSNPGTAETVAANKHGQLYIPGQAPAVHHEIELVD